MYSNNPVANTPAVVIGKNEGKRLQKCLISIAGKSKYIVYVDSGSTDNSCELATSMGIDVVKLDSKIPFTAGRARNAGFEHVLKRCPEFKYVQFIDGDCELVDGWLESAERALIVMQNVAIVCGRLREKVPKLSIYKQLCDIEWNMASGEVKACGGVAMVRAQAFQEIGGFNPRMIAGEEPELCVRLRNKGWKIVKLATDMAIHDADIYRFSQWWKRSRRMGFACAQGAAMYVGSEECDYLRKCWSLYFWGLIVPAVAIGGAWLTRGVSLLLIAGYFLLAIRIYWHGRRLGWSSYNAGLYSIFTVLMKWAGLVGMLQFYLSALYGRHSQLIKYKDIEEAK